MNKNYVLSLVFLLTAIFTNAQTLFDNLDHFYRLDAATITDEIGTANVFYSSSLDANGVVNSSHAFDNSDFISLFSYAPASFTINVWFRSNSDVVQRIFHRGGVGGSSTNRFSYSLVYIPNTGLRFSTGLANGSGISIFSAPISNIGTWRMITCTYDANSLTLKLFIDGSLISSATTSEQYPQNTNQDILQFSRYSNTTPQAINNGNLDEIGLWSRAITDAQVLELFQQQGTLTVGEANVTNGFSVYPNPVVNYINIKGLKTSKSYEIYTISGKKVANGIVSKNETIDVSQLAKGMYFLNLENKASYKFVK